MSALLIVVSSVIRKLPEVYHLTNQDLFNSTVGDDYNLYIIFSAHHCQNILGRPIWSLYWRN